MLRAYGARASYRGFSGGRAGQSAQIGTAGVKLADVLLDNPFVNEISPAGGLLRRIAAAFASFARYAGGSLGNHPLPEVREVGNEWRG